MQVGYNTIATEQCCNFSVALKFHQLCDRPYCPKVRSPLLSESAIAL
ncbi:MAG: hypothetical protein QQW96_01070 [Tychonema bourrellyi B0820]|nr:hypothetical protein [Tychonema bourrellyi]MDQ2096229.1 hypothetical protein [Tychonema bourrellyi B0820]